MSTDQSALVDVVVPVRNAPDLVRRCVESVLTHVGDRIASLSVADDASDAQTQQMLAALSHPKLRVLRSDENIGYGASVNRGVASGRAPLVLQLNSDVDAHGDFLSPLVAALAADPKLAALNPAGNTFRRYDFSRYAKRNGCVVTNMLSGYAFLVRRSVFEALGGFDPYYGIGYFEDTDLSRRILRAGYWLGVHPDSTLHHESHGSFPHKPDRRALIEKNRVRYHERWPAASRHVLLATRFARGSELPPALVEEAWGVLEGGGSIWWVSPEAPRDLLALGMRGDRMGFARGARRLRKLRREPTKRFTELWIVEGAPGFQVGFLRRAARAAGGVERRIWPAR